MARTGKKKAQYEASTLATYAVAGMVIIALGAVSLLSVVGGLRGALFTQVKWVMQGLGGGLCLGAGAVPGGPPGGGAHARRHAAGGRKGRAVIADGPRAGRV